MTRYSDSWTIHISRKNPLAGTDEYFIVATDILTTQKPIK
jgi:hypothetical protein